PTIVLHEEQAKAQATLTELFSEVRSANTPVPIERIVVDIDAIVRIVLFPGWHHTIAGEHEVRASCGVSEIGSYSDTSVGMAQELGTAAAKRRDWAGATGVGVSTSAGDRVSVRCRCRGLFRQSEEGPDTGRRQLHGDGHQDEAHEAFDRDETSRAHE